MDYQEALEWATYAEPGQYLCEYADDGLTAEEDTGSRCGFDDRELDELQSILRERDLCLETDDVGLCCCERPR